MSSIQALEARVLFAISAEVVNGILVVDGTEAGDVIQIAYVPASDKIAVNGGTGTGLMSETLFEFDAASINKLFVHGRDGPDTLTVTDDVTLPATLNGGGSVDFIDSGGGHTLVFGNSSGVNTAEDDIFMGGSSRTTVHGQGGNDSFYNLDQGLFDAFGGDGDDRFYAGYGIARFVGNGGNDTLTYEGWDEAVQVVVGMNRISGPRTAPTIHTVEPGIETVIATQYDDAVYGSVQNETFDVRFGHDKAYGGGGHDELIGGSGNDTLYGDDGNDHLNAGSGHDVLSDGKGHDTVHCGTGDDRINASGKNSGETIVVDGGNDIVYGHTGSDTFSGGNGLDTVFGGDGNDFFYGGVNAETLMGEGHDDMIEGGAGEDLLVGGTGADLLLATDGGTDYVYGGNQDGTGTEGYDRVFADQWMHDWYGDEYIVNEINLHDCDEINYVLYE